MVQKVQGVQNEEFLISEGNGEQSRENGIVTAGQNLPAGQVVEDVAGKLVALGAGTAVGILLYAVDATDGDVAGAYIARNAEVSTALLTGYAGSAATDLPTIILRTA